MITATLTRPNTASAEGVSVTHRTPVLQLCRELIAAGHEDQPMTVVDAATSKPVMHVASIAVAATVTVTESGNVRFKRLGETPAADPSGDASE